jgi:single-strand DNA-binding protein
MINYNRVILAGNLTKDPELRYTPTGTKTVSLRLAVNRHYRTKDNELKEDTCFVSVNVWDRMAEMCAERLQKGKPVFIEGRLQQRTWLDKNGEKRNILEVKAELVKFMDNAPISYYYGEK